MNWDITYACPLRCIHCYSESGRRPSRQLPLADMLRLADTLVAMHPKAIQISGGEPLVVKDLLEVAQRLSRSGARLAIYLSGFGVDLENARRMAQLFSWIHVSLDGPDAGTHDRVRGRIGSFDEAVAALAIFDQVAAEVRVARGRRLTFGIDCTLLQSTFEVRHRFCTEVAGRFQALRFLNLRPALASGLANRETFAESELLTEDQMATLATPEEVARVRALTPAVVERVSVEAALLPAMDRQKHGGEVPVDLMHVEPDGLVRGMPLYEGTVGNLLQEPPHILWNRVIERHADPFVTGLLARITNMREWAAAARKIDRRFAAPHDLVRISRRKPHGDPAPVS